MVRSTSVWVCAFARAGSQALRKPRISSVSALTMAALISAVERSVSALVAEDTAASALLRMAETLL